MKLTRCAAPPIAADSALDTPRAPKSCSLNGNCVRSSLLFCRYARIVLRRCQLCVATVIGYHTRISMVSRYEASQNTCGSSHSTVTSTLQCVGHDRALPAPRGCGPADSRHAALLDDVAPARFVERLAVRRAEKRLGLASDHGRRDRPAQILLDQHLQAEEQRAVVTPRPATRCTKTSPTLRADIADSATPCTNPS